MAVFTVIGKITNLFMILNETTADIFYDQPDIYLKCIEAGAKYLKEEPYPENNQDIKFKYGYHPEKVTNREKWWTNALRPIKPELKDHYGPGFTKKIKGIVWTLADEGNTALENMKQFISTGTCEQYEAFTKDDGLNDNNAGGLYIDDDDAFDKAYSSFDFHYPKPTCVECGAPLTKEEVERYDDTCEACALDDIGRDRRYDGPDMGDLFESIIKEGTNTEKKNYIDIKGEKAPLDWDRIDDKIEKIGFGKDLYECIIRESEIKSWYEPFMNFYYQIYNGGVSQPIGLNSGYYKEIDELLSLASYNDILAKIYKEKDIPEEVKPLFEEFVRNVVEVCDAVSSATFYRTCEYCGGSGEEYVADEDDDGNDQSYYETCSNCGGDGGVQCNYDEVDDPDNIKAFLNRKAQNAWDELENKCLEYQKMFKIIEGEE